MANASSFDVIVVGAGAAGLAAAAALAAKQCSVCVLEARERLGGRIFTRYDKDFASPLEMGAEFIHGRSRDIIAWLNRANAAMIDVSETRRMKHAGKLKPTDDLFGAMKRGLKNVRRPRADLPFADFLEGIAKRHLAPQVRVFARTLVEGFDAADATQVSTLSILDEWSGSSSADAPTFRPVGGYGVLISAMNGALATDDVRFELNAIVKEIRWQRHNVEVTYSQFGRSITARAKQAVIALPLGILQLDSSAPNAIAFAPDIKQKHLSLQQLGAGPVIKVLLRFKRAFWETANDGRYCDTSFFHAPGAKFPTFWTQLPLRSPLLVAWCAGPNAARLAGSSEAKIVDGALNSLQSLFSRKVKVRDELQGAYWHDWQADPYACGAYSYVKAGGLKARQQLAKPLLDTLFFAGEAVDTSGEAATVGGAIHSGERAAQLILAKR